MTAYRYDALGRAVGQTDSAGNVWSTGYDQLGNIVTADDPDTGVTTWSYNDASELTSTTDARGQTIAYLYDTLGRRIEQRDGSPTGPKLAAWSYDTATGGKGQPASATAYNAAGAVTYTNVVAGYTTLYKPTGATVTIPAGTVGNPAAITYKTTNTYTPATQLLYSSRIETTGAGGLLPTETVGYSYNVNGLPVASGGLSTYVSWVNYTHLGQPTRATMGVVSNQVVQTYSYDPFTRLAGYTVDRQNGLSSVSDVSYTRNPAGHVTSITDVQGGGPPPQPTGNASPTTT